MELCVPFGIERVQLDVVVEIIQQVFQDTPAVSNDGCRSSWSVILQVDKGQDEGSRRLTIVPDRIAEEIAIFLVLLLPQRL